MLEAMPVNNKHSHIRTVVRIHCNICGTSKTHVEAAYFNGHFYKHQAVYRGDKCRVQMGVHAVGRILAVHSTALLVNSRGVGAQILLHPESGLPFLGVKRRAYPVFQPCRRLILYGETREYIEGKVLCIHIPIYRVFLDTYL